MGGDGFWGDGDKVFGERLSKGKSSFCGEEQEERSFAGALSDVAGDV